MFIVMYSIKLLGGEKIVQSHFSLQLLMPLSRWKMFTGMMIVNSKRFAFSERDGIIILLYYTDW